MESAEAISAANQNSGIKPREWLRVSIVSDTLISMPVAGSASALKNHHPFSWCLAPEAQKVAVKAAATLSTVYGRTPFFHLLEESFSLAGKIGEPASSLCMRAFHNVEEILGINENALIHALRDSMEQKTHRIHDICSYTAKKANMSLSIIDTLCRLGPDAIFALVFTF